MLSSQSRATAVQIVSRDLVQYAISWQIGILCESMVFLQFNSFNVGLLIALPWFWCPGAGRWAGSHIPCRHAQYISVSRHDE